MLGISEAATRKEGERRTQSSASDYIRRSSKQMGNKGRRKESSLSEHRCSETFTEDTTGRWRVSDFRGPKLGGLNGLVFGLLVVPYG